MEKENLQQRFDELTTTLLEWQNRDGYWDGELSSSALGVAVACAALHFHDQETHRESIEKGMCWLQANINTDGGFGDTADSISNISTSLLCYASVYLNREFLPGSAQLLQQISGYLNTAGIDVHSPQVIEAILDHYKTDRTFSVPILTMCALCGIPDKNAFENIPQLPFELAMLPRGFYRMLNLSVVSYAIPALVAVGIAIFRHKKKKNIFLKPVRQASIQKTMKLLEKMMPESGGFLEAIPLTAFVSLCLINSGFKDSAVVEKGIGFLLKSQRDNGSWPIDIDLSSWVTNLAVKSLGSRLHDVLTPGQRQKIAGHFLSIQNKTIHPFNGTSPGGWGWTHYSGSVPDCDDTPGVILALIRLQENENQYETEIINACNWLLKLQNSDGGFPTFARGWGKLPFDQSCADLTGHVVLALSKTIDLLNPVGYKKQIRLYKKSVRKAVNYLTIQQKENGALLPLWFGNQLTNDHHNPVYGTARVVSYLNDTMNCERIDDRLKTQINRIISKGVTYLLSVQNQDGSWGGGLNIPGSIEETSLALSAIMPSSEKNQIEKGFNWLDREYKTNGLKASPIGLYFASLWYHEKMYPLVMYTEALTRAMET